MVFCAGLSLVHKSDPSVFFRARLSLNWDGTDYKQSPNMELYSMLLEGTSEHVHSIYITTEQVPLTYTVFRLSSQGRVQIPRQHFPPLKLSSGNTVWYTQYACSGVTVKGLQCPLLATESLLRAPSNYPGCWVPLK